VTIHIVDIEQTTHTCPADPEPHVVNTRRTVVHVIAGGPCRTPVTIHCGTTMATIPCGRHEPADRQCGACRTIVTEHTITTHYLDHHAEVAA
jgi:hypothetical protein